MKTGLIFMKTEKKSEIQALKGAQKTHDVSTMSHQHDVTLRWHRINDMCQLGGIFW